jgi:hypothetical protein
MSIRKAAEKYCVAVGTVAGWKQNKLKYQQLVAENGNLDQIRASRLTGNAQELDDRIYSWPHEQGISPLARHCFVSRLVQLQYTLASPNSKHRMVGWSRFALAICFVFVNFQVKVQT